MLWFFDALRMSNVDFFSGALSHTLAAGDQSQD